MWENYLYDRPAGIWGEIGGMVEVNGNLPLDQGRWTNACAVRLSHMLNKAGHKIPRVEIIRLLAVRIKISIINALRISNAICWRALARLTWP